MATRTRDIARSRAQRFARMIGAMQVGARAMRYRFRFLNEKRVWKEDPPPAP